MHIIRRRVLRLMGLAAAAITFPKLALAVDSGTGAELKLAMGPTSAAQKPGGPVPRPAPVIIPCGYVASPCATPGHYRKRRTRRYRVPPR
jgi:hypothetical protein